MPRVRQKRAEKGSQEWLQLLVNRAPYLIDRAIGNPGFQAIAASEIYDPLTGRGRSVPSSGHQEPCIRVTELIDGRLLVVGGLTAKSSAAATGAVGVYDPSLSSFTLVSPLPSFQRSKSVGVSDVSPECSLNTVASNSDILPTGA